MFKGWYTWRPWKLSNFQDPSSPLTIYVQNYLILSPTWPWTSNFKRVLLCVQLSKNITKCLEKQPYRACERAKSKQKRNQVMSHSNWPRVLLFDLAHKQCNGINKGWIHCLTSGSKGRSLVNNILMFGSAWCMVISQIQFSLIKTNIGRPEHLLNPHPPTSDNISFLPYPHPPIPSKWTMCITPNWKGGKTRKMRKKRFPEDNPFSGVISSLLMLFFDQKVL